MTDHWVDLPLCSALFNVSFYGFSPECEGRVNSRSCSKHRRWAQHPTATEKVYRENKAQKLLNTGPVKAAACQQWPWFTLRADSMCSGNKSFWLHLLPPSEDTHHQQTTLDVAESKQAAQWFVGMQTCLVILVVLATWTPFKSEDVFSYQIYLHQSWNGCQKETTQSLLTCANCQQHQTQALSVAQLEPWTAGGEK